MADDQQSSDGHSSFAVRLKLAGARGSNAEGLKGAPLAEAELEKLLGPAREMQARMAFLTGGVKQAAKLVEQLEAIRAPLSDRILELQNVAAPAREMHKRMRRLTDAVSGSSGLAKLANQIAGQQKAIEVLSGPELTGMAIPCPPEPRVFQDIPPNPTYETNDRLKRIEVRFQKMQRIAAESANIANALQGAAAEFLVKFERAAKDNERAAGKAIGIAKSAIAIALLASLIQVIYTEFWRVPHDTAAMQAAVSEMKTEIASLRADQANVAEWLATALMNADRDNAQILREIRDLLGGPSATSEPAPDE